jgi:hypothetical protein
MNRGVTLFVILLCTIFLVIQSTDAHVHLCFDGQEPAVSIHIENRTELTQHLTKVGLDHHDLDIDLGVNSISKLPKVDLPVLALLFSALFIAFNLQGKPPIARSRSTRFRYQSPSHFRPPLRGPPALSVR